MRIKTTLTSLNLWGKANGKENNEWLEGVGKADIERAENRIDSEGAKYLCEALKTISLRDLNLNGDSFSNKSQGNDNTQWL